MLHISLGGVPEHFNYPWQYAIANQAFSQAEVHWLDYPGGTGAMCKDLRDGELDMAIVLTEGIVSDIAKGNKVTILQPYVESSLLWGIHTHPDENTWPEKPVFAISRPGSGSHLMAYQLAEQKGWDISNIEFVIVQNLDGGIQAINEGRANLFLWEQFTTQPYVDKSMLYRLDVLPTPWPCFMVVARTEFYEKNKQVIQEVLTTIRNLCSTLSKNPFLSERIAERYDLDIEEVEQWLSKTEWNTKSTTVDSRIIDQVNASLERWGVLNPQTI